MLPSSFAKAWNGTRKMALERPCCYAPRQEPPAMSDASLVRRVDMLEETLNSLKQLPGRFTALEQRFDGLEGRFITVEGRLGVVESQIVQLRTEMRDEFSAVRREMATKQELAALKAELQDDIYGVNRDLTGHIVETQRQMRVLYEDLVARISTIGESRSGKSYGGKWGATNTRSHAPGIP